MVLQVSPILPYAVAAFVCRNVALPAVCVAATANGKGRKQVHCEEHSEWLEMAVLRPAGALAVGLRVGLWVQWRQPGRSGGHRDRTTGHSDRGRCEFASPDAAMGEPVSSNA